MSFHVKLVFLPSQVIKHTYSNWNFESCRYDWLSHILSCFVCLFAVESKSVIVDRILAGQYSLEYCLLRFIRASFNSSLIKLEKLQTTIYRRKTNIIGVDDMNMFKGVLLFLTGQVDDRTIQKYEKEAEDKNRVSCRVFVGDYWIWEYNLINSWMNPSVFILFYSLK